MLRRFALVSLFLTAGLAAAAARGQDTAPLSLEALARRAEIRYSNLPHKVLAFYYPWYGNAEVAGGSRRWAHWEGVDVAAKAIDSSTHYPALGPFDSHDGKTIARHAEWSKQAGLDGWIVSWWGKNSFTDEPMPTILDTCQKNGLEASIYYEKVPGNDPQRAVAEILDLLKRYGKHPAWLRADGRPVVFVYVRALQDIGLDGWLAVADRLDREYPGGVALIGDQLSPASARVFDGIHTYNTAGQLRGKDVDQVVRWAAERYPEWVKMAADRGRISTITVIPGYDDTKIRKPGLAVDRFDGRSYRAQWEAATAAAPDWVLITSFNEWHEGSEIEPSAEYGEKYIKLTAELSARFRQLPPREALPAGSGAPRVTPQQRATLAQIKPGSVGLLPGAGLAAAGTLVDLGIRPRQLTSEEVAALQADSVDKLPVLIYAGDEVYQHTVRKPGDVAEGLRRWLSGGGLLIVAPSGPMPMHYDRQHRGVDAARRIGLPLGVGPAHGGWEHPPEGKQLTIHRVDELLPNLPAQIPFPDGDPRWRPLLRRELAAGDRVVPLLELRDQHGTDYGPAAVYIEHLQSEPKGGKILYAWFGLMHSPQSADVLAALLAYATGR